MPMVLCLEIVNVNIHPSNWSIIYLYYFQYFHSSTIFIQNYFSFVQQQYCSTIIHPLHSHSCVQQIALMFVKQWRKNNYFNYERHSYILYCLWLCTLILFEKFIFEIYCQTYIGNKSGNGSFIISNFVFKIQRNLSFVCCTWFDCTSFQ